MGKRRWFRASYPATMMFLSLLLMFLSTCSMPGPSEPTNNPTPIETPLAFETVEQTTQNNYPGTKLYKNKEPKIVIITQPEDLRLLDDTVTSHAYNELQAVDFDQYFILAIYQGHKGNMDSGVTVHSVAIHDRSISINVSFIEPTLGTPYSPIESSPYQVIKIPKADLKGMIDFVVKNDGQIVIEEPYVFD